jgi:hypothetical protein
MLPEPKSSLISNDTRESVLELAGHMPYLVIPSVQKTKFLTALAIESSLFLVCHCTCVIS